MLVEVEPDIYENLEIETLEFPDTHNILGKINIIFKQGKKVLFDSRTGEWEWISK